MKLMMLMLVVILSSSQITVMAGSTENFQAGVIAYNEGDFSRAEQSFEAIQEQGLVSSELFYNLGNCAFRQENIARAILYWERARLLSPHDADILRNLELAAGLLADPAPPDAQLPFWRLVDRLLDSLAQRSWGIILLVSVWLLAVVIGWRILRFTRLSKRLTPYFIVLLLVTLTLFTARIYRDSNDNRAVIMVDKVTIRSAPDSLAAELFDLHSGSQVELLETAQKWRRIRLPNGQGGWLPQECITAI
jgi:tetratricopeptide (TPR) repeat protein